MKKVAFRVMAPVLLLSFGALAPLQLAGARDTAITLPQPLPAKTSLLEAMQKRRTTRVFSLQQKLTLQELANLLYAMQGVSAANKRTVPSSMGAYPIELYVVVSRVSGVPDGLYRYVVSNHSLTLLRPGDPSADLA
jgi:hypothetical protein